MSGWVEEDERSGLSGIYKVTHVQHQIILEWTAGHATHSLNLHHLLGPCRGDYMRCRFGVVDQSATHKVSTTVANFNKRIAAESEDASSVLAFCRAELDAAAGSVWQSSLTEESWQSG